MSWNPSNNPYSSSGNSPYKQASFAKKSHDTGPQTIAAILLIVMASITLLIDLIYLLLATLGMVAAANAPQNPNIDNDKLMIVWAYLGSNLLSWVIAGILQVVVIFGGISMLKSRNYPLAMAGTIISLIPCCGPLCGLSIPVGIWALVLLLDQNVKSRFR